MTGSMIKVTDFFFAEYTGWEEGVAGGNGRW